MTLADFTHVVLSVDYDIKQFKCKDDDLNSFLLDDAKGYLLSKMAVTYLFEDNISNKTVAYYSLLNDKITFDPERKSFWNKLNRKGANKKRRKDYPAIKIGRLAINQGYIGNGLGSEILTMIKYMFANQNRTGCRFITVDAYSDVTPFYLKCGFDFLTDKDINDATRSMYFDLMSFAL
jgi:predicted GNAT family N-acyltransferase